MKFPKLLPLLFVGSLFVFSSCSEDDKENDPDPIPGDKICRPVKVTAEDGVTAITYNNDKISTFSNEEFGNVTVSYHTSGNKAGKPSKLTFAAGEEGTGSLEYVYDEQGKLIGNAFVTAQMQGGGLVAEYEYTQNRVSKITRAMVFPSEEEGGEPDVVMMGFTTYEYDAKGNVTVAREFFDNPATEEDESTTPQSVTQYTYDNKPSPVSAFEALFMGVPTINPASPNNILTAVHREGNTVKKDLSYTNVYVFNENGYPTKTTQTTQNGETTVTNIDYSCN
ncbi:hypothetical protein [Rufibacter psychrotolerans]|uniref:hypothetical protein n=1 Tax=Rufibacter psychrotolerans TaxID=2812556 RepID=UPI0019682E6B|nr:hypothetical protein [Rufibacter sp. SYSU D00308]